MKTNIFVNPIDHTSLHLEVTSGLNGEVVEGRLLGLNGETYPIIDGIPDFTILSDIERNNYAKELFKAKAEEYDKYQHLSFETFYEDESAVRNSMIDKLCLQSNACVLEVNAGTGRDSVLIANRLSSDGILHVQDISNEMLNKCKNRLRSNAVPIEIHQGNAGKLPYSDRVFDAVYSFGGVGMNTYSGNKDAIAEMVRVTKIGGRIVFGGLSLAPWLRDTFFGKVLTNHNSHYSNSISFSDFPIQARKLNVSWTLAGAGFVVDFTVGEGGPVANFQHEIPGPRGGTHLTRYFGNLEGVTEETKKLAIEAREKLGISMHEWLDNLVKKEAQKILDS